MGHALEHLIGRGITQIRVDAGYELILFDEHDDVRVRLTEFAIRFVSGVGTLTAEPSEDSEAWEVAGPGTKSFVCTPGGEVAEWV
jgi:hypothetical protein